jgi:RNA polymerase sigma factor (sigma-70 family)
MRRTAAVGVGPSRGSDPEGDIARVYAEEADRLRRLAYLITGRADAAEEVVQEAFARSARIWPTIQTPGAYLRTATVNLASDWRRRAAADRARSAPLVAVTVSPPEIDETWRLLTRLPHHQRVALVLRYYADLSVDTIAETVGCRPGTVRTRIHRALATLRKEMTP